MSAGIISYALSELKRVDRLHNQYEVTQIRMANLEAQLKAYGLEVE